MIVDLEQFEQDDITKGDIIIARVEHILDAMFYLGVNFPEIKDTDAYEDVKYHAKQILEILGL